MIIIIDANQQQRLTLQWIKQLVNHEHNPMPKLQFYEIPTQPKYLLLPLAM